MWLKVSNGNSLNAFNRVLIESERRGKPANNSLILMGYDIPAYVHNLCSTRIYRKNKTSGNTKLFSLSCLNFERGICLKLNIL